MPGMSESPGKAPVPSGFGDDGAPRKLALAQPITSIDELSPLREVQVDRLMERIRRLDTPELEGLIRALRRILTQAITVSAERPETQSLTLSSQSTRTAVAIRASEHAEPSLHQAAAQASAESDNAPRGRPSRPSITALFLVSISIAVGAAIGIVAFKVKHFSSSSHLINSAPHFDATTRLPNSFAPEYISLATQTSSAEDPSSRVKDTAEGQLQIETEKDGSGSTTQAPVEPSNTDNSDSNHKSSLTGTPQDALTPDDTSSNPARIPARPSVLLGLEGDDRTQQKNGVAGSLTPKTLYVSGAGMPSQSMLTKPDSDEIPHANQGHVDTAEAADVPASQSSDRLPKGPVASETAADGIRRASQIGAGSPNSAELKLLLERADRSLSFGDISAARLFYERAAEVGSAAGAAGVGKTYDPLFLAQIGAQGPKADAVLASWWYRKASNAGDQEAGKRLNALTAKLNQ